MNPRKMLFLLVLLVAAIPAAAHVNVFGPKTFTTSAGAPQSVSETVSLSGPCDLGPSAVYTLVVTNDGVSSASIRVNGAEVVGEQDFNQNVSSIERTVTLAASNTLTATIKGGTRNGSLTLTIRRHIDLTESVFTAKTYTTTGKSDVFRDSFSAAGVSGPFEIVVRNGSMPVKSASVRLNGAEVVSEQALASAAVVRRSVSLAASNDLVIDTKADAAGASLSVAVIRHVTDSAGPQIVHGLTSGQVIASTPLTISGTVTDPSGVAAFAVNGTAVAVGAGGAFSTSVNLVEGSNTIRFAATDCEGNVTQHDVTVTLEVAPALVITTPRPNALIGSLTVAMAGTVSSTAGIQSLTANGAPMTVSGTSWSGSVTLTAGDGARDITVVVTDTAGRQTTRAVTVRIDTTGPALEVQAPPVEVVETHATEVEFSGSVVDAIAGIADVTCNGTPAARINGGWNCTLSMQPGANLLTLRAVDTVGNVSTATRSLQYVSDTVAPTITAVVSGTAGAAGWYRGSATVIFQCADNFGVICPPPATVAADGANQPVSGEASDMAGNRASTSVTVSVDATNPVLTIDGETERTTSGQVPITGSATDATSGVAGVTCNGTAATRNGAQFECTATLPAGDHTIRVVGTDVAGNEATADVLVLVDRSAPVVTSHAPSEDVVTNDASIEVAGIVEDDHGIAAITIAGQPAGSGPDFAQVVSLANGVNTIEVRATDRAGNTGSATVAVRRYERALIDIVTPADFAVTSASSVNVSGTISGPVTSIDVNEIPAAISGSSFTAANVPLAQGRTVVTATARTSGGQIVADHINLYRDSIPPRVEVYTPATGATVTSSPITVSGMVDDIVIGTINAGQVRVTVNGVQATLANRSFVAQNITLSAGVNTLTIVATDQAGNATTETHVVTYQANRPRVVIAAGNGQSAPIGTALPELLRVRVVDAAGTAVPNATVHFEVTQNDGTLTSGDQSGREITVTANAAGEATARWTLGHRAGAGNHRVTVTADGAEGSAEFHATGRTGVPALIVADSGGSQFGISNEPTARPLVAVVVDAGSNRLAGVPVTFSVLEGGGSFDGGSTLVVTTDSDGRAVATPRLGPGSGADNNRFAATVTGVENGVIFSVTGRPSGPPSETHISGVILDNTNLPVPGVTIRIDETTRSTTSDAQGAFTFASAPVGYVKLIVDGSTAQRPGTWPMLEFVMYTNSGQDNTLGMPIYLLPIDVTRGVQVSETTGGMLTFPELPGFSLTIAPGSALFPNGSRAGTVSATLVHADKMPMVPGFGQQPRFIVTIQPPGVHFDPPAKLTLPNLDGLAPGEITELYSFDHDLGQFIAIGTGSVSEDGTTIVSDPGVGIIKGGWHCGGNPTPTGTASCLTLTVDADVPEQTGSGGPTLRSPRIASLSSPPARRVAITATADPKVTATGACARITATGSPGGAGYTYQWSVISGNGTINPSCANQAQCTLRGNSQGEVTARMTYSAPTGQTKSETVKVRFVNLQLSLKSLEFLDSIELWKDEPTWFQPPWLPNTPPPAPPAIPKVAKPEWKNTNASTDNGPAAYVRNKKMKVKAIFTVNAPLAANLPKVHFEANMFGGGFPRLKTESPVTINQGQNEVTVTMVGATELPNVTGQHDLLMTFDALPPSACPFPLTSGTVNQKLYVTLAQPTMTAYLSSVHIATAAGSAMSVEQAVDFTWGQFGNGSEPTHVRGWKNQPFKYYPPPEGFGPCMGTLEAILSAHDGSTRCGGLAALARSAMAMHGIPTTIIDVRGTNTAGQMLGMLVRNWDFGPPVVVGSPDWKWRFETYSDVPNQVNEMVPPPNAAQPTKYGDITSLSGVPGQWSPTPTEKAHSNHGIIGVNNRILDPSYGLEYYDQADFETKALSGYWGLVPAWNTTKVKIVRMPGPDTSIIFNPAPPYP